MSDETSQRRWGGVLIPAATFLVGLLIGGLVIGVGKTGGGSSDEAANGGSSGSSSSSSSSSPTPTTTGSASPGETVVTVPAACQQAGDKVREATTLLRSTIGDVRNFKPNRIVDELNRLEDLDSQIRPLLQECSQVDVSTAAAPSPSPSGS